MTVGECSLHVEYAGGTQQEIERIRNSMIACQARMVATSGSMYRQMRTQLRGPDIVSDTLIVAWGMTAGELAMFTVVTRQAKRHTAALQKTRRRKHQALQNRDHSISAVAEEKLRRETSRHRSEAAALEKTRSVARKRERSRVLPSSFAKRKRRRGGAAPRPA